MEEKKIKKMTQSALFIALGIILPFFTGQIKEVGNMLLPMHIPVILCALICGRWYGLAVGLILPVLRSVTFSMPQMYPTAISMAFELATYGFVVGFLYEKSRWKCIRALYRAMLSAMLLGRGVWGAVMYVLMGISGGKFTFWMFFSATFINSIPGILLQLVIIPSVMVALKKAKLVPPFGHRKTGEKNDR